MATHKSALKRSRTSERQRERNAAVRSSIKTDMKKVLVAVEEKDTETAKTVLAEAAPAIARASAKGAIHKKTAARRISRLTRKVNALKG